MQVLEGISDIRDESDRTGMRVVIEVRTTIFYFYLESGDFNFCFLCGILIFLVHCSS